MWARRMCLVGESSWSCEEVRDYQIIHTRSNIIGLLLIQVEVFDYEKDKDGAD